MPIGGSLTLWFPLIAINLKSSMFMKFLRPKEGVGSSSLSEGATFCYLQL